MSARVDELLAALTTEEKARLVMGESMWRSHPVERLGIPGLVMTDGPNGARGGGLMGTGTPTACIPAGSVLGATWDPELVERLGGLLGDECRAKGAHVLLAPTVNLHRHPLGGRNFECYSEDPYLSGRLAAAFVRGVQSRRVATTVKHFVANDSEFERNTIDSRLDERTLREVYLVPFEHAVTDGGTWGVMSSYNRVNGTFASENEWLLGTVLREEWGFDGFVVSDWYATRSTAASVRAGLSIEMPGEGRFYGPQRIAAALGAGEIHDGHLDAVVRDVLVAMERTGALDGEGGGDEKPLDRTEDRALIREAATAGTVLIRNDGVLPLDPAQLTSLAVIGPNARRARIMGGGSAGVNAYRGTSPLDALQARLGDRVTIRFAQGCDIDRSAPPVAPPLLQGDLTVDIHDGLDHEGEPVATTTATSGRFLFLGAPAEGVAPERFSLRAHGRVVPEASGVHRLRLFQSGRTRVLLDGVVVLDATEGDLERGDEFVGFASVEVGTELELDAGRSYELTIEYSSRDAVVLSGVSVGLVADVERDLVGEAEALARESDAAVVVVGTNDDWETEGRDRDQFALPGDQAELIRSVAAVNPRTVVVLNTGGPHELDWLDEPAAVLSVGFGGQELGDALVDVLLGERDPGGRMPTTVPSRIEHSPAYLDYPGENSVVRYAEGIHIGHRWFDARHIEPAVPFGHGLSYATFAWGEVRAPAEASTELPEAVVVEVDVTNTSDRAGVEVVQLYIEPPPSLLRRPPRELKGFAKLHLDAGATGTASIELDRRAFAYFDPADPGFGAVAALAPVPAARGRRRTEPGWYVEPGPYRLVLARSSADPGMELRLVLHGADTMSAP